MLKKIENGPSDEAVRKPHAEYSNHANTANCSMQYKGIMVPSVTEMASQPSRGWLMPDGVKAVAPWQRSQIKMRHSQDAAPNCGPKLWQREQSVDVSLAVIRP